jgi:hypothetical protein
MDLGVQYAIDNGWSSEDVEAMKWTDEKVKRKFEKPFWGNTAPVNASAMEEEWQRFLDA